MINEVKKGRGLFYAQRVGPIEIIGPRGFARRREDGVVWLAVDSVGMGSHRWGYFSKSRL